MSPDPARQTRSRDQALGEAQPGNGHRPVTEPARPDPQGADRWPAIGHAPESGLGQPLVAFLVASGC